MAKIKGVQSRPCPTCDGEGTIMLSNEKRVPCKTCNGSGAVKA